MYKKHKLIDKKANLMYNVFIVNKINKGKKMFGFNKKDDVKKVSKQSAKPADIKAAKPAPKKSGKASQADEAKAMLASMEQRKKDRPDDCVFC